MRSTLQYIKRLTLMGCVIFLLDYTGILVHLFELDYHRYFDYPTNDILIGGDGDPRNIAAVSTDNNYTFVYNLSAHCNETPHLTILIKSAITNYDRRKAIRRTWGFEQRFSDVKIKRLFLLGTTLDAEAMHKVYAEMDQHKDIVVINFLDNYFNNTVKTLSGMRWALNNCKNSRYFMFVDDDYYVSLKNVLKFLAHPAMYPKKITTNLGISTRDVEDHQKNLFAGFVLQTSPLRQKFSKWYISLREYPYDLWPPYVTAGLFILSQDVLSKLYNSSLHIKMFRFDDIFLGIAALKGKIPLTHCKMFYFYRPKYTGPESYVNVIGSHGFENPMELEKVWNECRSAGFA